MSELPEDFDLETLPPEQRAYVGQPKLVEAAITAGTAGSVLFAKDPAQTNRLQRLAVQTSRLGIPLLFGFDVIHGLRTIFPVPIALAATWSPATIETAQGVAAREARAVGIAWTFAPMVDIARDPRWGRIIEGPGDAIVAFDRTLTEELLHRTKRAGQLSFQNAFPGRPNWMHTSRTDYGVAITQPTPTP